MLFDIFGNTGINSLALQLLEFVLINLLFLTDVFDKRAMGIIASIQARQ